MKHDESFGRPTGDPQPASFRLVPGKSKEAVGIVAGVMALACGAFVFGPFSDARTVAMSGVHDAGSSGYADGRDAVASVGAAGTVRRLARAALPAGKAARPAAPAADERIAGTRATLDTGPVDLALASPALP